MRQKMTLLVFVLTAIAAGCAPAHVNHKAPAPIHSVNVDAIELYASPPSAISWNATPGLDGVQVVTRFYQLSQPQPVIVEGEVEFLMYEGIVKAENLLSTKVFQSWEFTSSQLPQFAFRTYGLIGYTFQLGWNHLPATPAVTVACRYRRPSGEFLYAKPIVVQVRN